MSATSCSFGFKVDITVSPDVMPTVQRTITAMQWAELDDAMQMVLERMIKSGRLLQIGIADGKATLLLRPFAELALLDVRAVAMAKLDSATKSKRIEWVLNLAGY